MYELGYQGRLIETTAGWGSSEAALQQRALRLYRRTLLAGRLGGLWAALMRRPATLDSLRGAAPGDRARGCGQIAAVSLADICGSEGRCADFSRAFQPLQSHSRDRWLSVATARLRRIALPRVMLVRVGAGYFVRDGHHRISVARALGEAYIDAEVV